MGTDATVVVPWQDNGDLHRRAALDWLLTWLPHLGLPVVVGSLSPDRPWRKADAVAAALPSVYTDRLILWDADVWCSPAAIGAALEGAREWAVPHASVYRLDRATSERVTRGELGPEQLGRRSLVRCERHPYRGVVGGGIVVLSSELYDRAPFDRRFVGWGQEDITAGVVWTALAGLPWRGHAPLYHLHHRVAPKQSAGVGSSESHLLYKRYLAVLKDRPALMRLIDEGKASDALQLQEQDPLPGADA